MSALGLIYVAFKSGIKGGRKGDNKKEKKRGKEEGKKEKSDGCLHFSLWVMIK